MGCLEGSGVPVLYIGRTVPKVNCAFFGRFPGIWFILADVSEHSIRSIFKADDLEVAVHLGYGT
jgi:hypothetical protein